MSSGIDYLLDHKFLRLELQYRSPESPLRVRYPNSELTSECKDRTYCGGVLQRTKLTHGDAIHGTWK